MNKYSKLSTQLELSKYDSAKISLEYCRSNTGSYLSVTLTHDDFRDLLEKMKVEYDEKQYMRDHSIWRHVSVMNSNYRMIVFKNHTEDEEGRRDFTDDLHHFMLYENDIPGMSTLEEYDYRNLLYRKIDRIEDEYLKVFPDTFDSLDDVHIERILERCERLKISNLWIANNISAEYFDNNRKCIEKTK